MKVTYDPEVDILRIILSSAPIEERRSWMLPSG